MNIFIINNKFHLLDIQRQVSSGMDINDIYIICIPHTISEFDLQTFGAMYSIVKSPMTSRFSKYNPFLVFFARRKINRIINELANISLKVFFYNEIELLNQYVVLQFKKFGAKTILIEENGLATYSLNKIGNKKNKLLLRKPNWFLPISLWGLNTSKYAESDGVVYPLLMDKNIDCTVYYNNVSCNRDIEVVYFIKKTFLGVNESGRGSVLYLNQDLYNFFMTKNEYDIYIEQELNLMLSTYGTVYFKFHPREKDSNFESWFKHKYQGLSYIDSNEPVENIIKDIEPDVVRSFMSSSLLNLAMEGVVVHFSFENWSGYKRSPMLLAISDSLKEIRLRNNGLPTSEIASLSEI
ncbi:alpha-2,8-polysialyltransferase family protein [Shewanella chilikensis]|uniref:alpha-2,8-polysialyltransferase family protein n=1 Tax=Shewanella chilikensis TaxID=558541 RepID=UPI00200CF2FA|nr:alpha-2,8-polysialyltransferase family protein [Shewanella chilikensis]MCL1160664.1 alpha-2,8-polysialyltransferase family protein [Shewanella chilikensis]